MGLNLIGVSKSTYDSPKEKIVSPNPDPKKCEIENYTEIGEFLILKIKYDGCNTFEGNKILVYYGVSIDSLKLQQSQVGLDPHFSETILYYSPIARFRPDYFGVEMALKFCNSCAILKGEK